MRICLIFLLSFLLVLQPQFVFASELSGFSIVTNSFNVGIVAVAVFLINFALCIWNVSRKKTVIAVINIVVTLIFAVVIYPAILFLAVLGSQALMNFIFIFLGILVLLKFRMIYKAFKT